MKRVVLFLILGVLAGLPESARGADKNPLEALRLQAPGDRVEAPDFALLRLGGDTLRLRDLRGKVVLLNFWATWCVPCRAEMPDIERLSREFAGRGLVVVAVNLQEGRRAVRRFVDELHLTFPVVLDGDGKMAAAYGVRPIPTTFLIDQNGFILGRSFGPQRWASQGARTHFARLLAGGRALAGEWEAR